MVCVKELMLVKQNYIEAVKANTIKFCDTILDAELRASITKSVCGARYEFGWLNEKEGIVAPLKVDYPKYYSNRKDSQCPDETSPLHLPTLIQYVEQNCFVVSGHDMYYMRANHGEEKGYVFMVLVPHKTTCCGR